MKPQPILFARLTAQNADAKRLVATAALLVGCGVFAACSGSGDENSSPSGTGPGDMPNLPPGAIINPDGTVVNADGTPVTNPDGTPVTVPDGANPDGTPVTNPDGTPVTNPDGTPVTNPDGTPVTDSGDCIPGVPGTSQLPRLTRAQYANTIRDLFGISTDAASMLAPDSPGSVDQRAWEGYQTSAATIAAQVIADADAKARVVPCAGAGDEAACVQQFVSDFGRRAFRRPLTDTELARFEALYTTRAETTPNGTFDEAAQLIIESFLLSPSFLTRAEISEEASGDHYVLNDYEVASRLSYMLWGSMPDDALLDAAEAGTLSTAAEILAQAQRMLLDPKARDQVAAFHEQYAHMGAGTRWAEITRDTAVFPDFGAGVVPMLSEETELLFDYVTFEGGTFQDLITTPKAFVNASTAALYDLDASQFGVEMAPVDLDPTIRPGIFTRLGFLASHASFDRTSPILRGAFLQKEILCTEVPPPPPGVEGTPLPTEGLTTNRERVDAQTAGTDCANCHHVIINPTGYALESFDAVGSVQTTDNGVPVDTVASVLIGGATVDVAGPAELMTAIANSVEAQRCYAEKWVAYGYQREANAADACVVDAMTGKLAQGNYTILNLIADLTQSDSFRYRAIETEVAQ